MTTLETQDDLDDLFKLELSEFELNNRRALTRYVRNDLTAIIYRTLFFGFKRTEPVELLDLSCKGALVQSSKKLPLKTKVVLAITFTSGKTFKIQANIIRKSEQIPDQYGLKFNHYNNELGDYLFETQKELIFK
ncbi:MAG: hypothetical protein CTY29_09855 [Methylobacter sp.]|nr:MAG: hypothetical protein CTY29_09855 [Methylobacter sp.]